MKYSKLELKRLFKMDNKDVEDKIKVNILNFIDTIHENRQNFVEEPFNTEFFGDLGMTFQKKRGQVMGLIRVHIKATDERRSYIFTENGYEQLDGILALKNLTDDDLRDDEDNW